MPDRSEPDQPLAFIVATVIGATVALAVGGLLALRLFLYLAGA